jgi:endonuclease/exonuclease/phosphatase family metal-dependent hydrolase
VRVVSWNVQSLRGSPSGVRALLRACDADVVCLQEVPRFVAPSWRLRRFARACGLLVAGRCGGVAVLVGPAAVVRRAGRARLSPTTRLHRRAVVVAGVVVDGRAATVASIHLGLDAAERQRHAAEVVAFLSSYDAPCILGGDLNEAPGEAAWHALEAVGAPANTTIATFPAAEPVHVLDTVFVGAPLTVAAVNVVGSTASDHRPVVVELR